jgi:hypothetical protein
MAPLYTKAQKTTTTLNHTLGQRLTSHVLQPRADRQPGAVWQLELLPAPGDSAAPGDNASALASVAGSSEQAGRQEAGSTQAGSTQAGSTQAGSSQTEQSGGHRYSAMRAGTFTLKRPRNTLSCSTEQGKGAEQLRYRHRCVLFRVAARQAHHSRVGDAGCLCSAATSIGPTPAKSPTCTALVQGTGKGRGQGCPLTLHEKPKMRRLSGRVRSALAVNLQQGTGRLNEWGVAAQEVAGGHMGACIAVAAALHCCRPTAHSPQRLLQAPSGGLAYLRRSSTSISLRRQMAAG